MKIGATVIEEAEVKSESQAEKRALWRERIESFRAIGKSGHEFCRETGYNYYTLQNWIKIFQKDGSILEKKQSLRKDAPALKEIKVDSGFFNSKEIYELELANSLVVRIPNNFSESTLSRLGLTLRSL